MESMLGGAGSGEVFLAEHTKLHRKRVIKRIRKNHPFYEQLAGEAAILARLEHPGIPRLYDVEEDDQYLYLIEEFIEGISLKNIVLSDRLRELQIIHIALQICNIIQYLHQQEPPVYYLDLKPEHLLLSEGRVTLIDYGSAVRASEKKPEEQGTALYLGTEGYAAPELYHEGMAGPYSDVYGIGSVIRFLMTETGVCTRRLWGIVKKCMSPEADRRCGLGELTGSLEKLDRTRGRRQNKKTVSHGKHTIGLIGTHPGAGVTHISLLLASYLSEATGRSVAYLEYNHHGDCGRLMDRGKWSGGSFKRVDLFPDISAEDLSRVMNQDYTYYVIDFGCEPEEHLIEYLRCEGKIVVAQLTEWRLDDLEQFEIREKEIERHAGWHYLYNLNEDRQIRGTGLAGSCFPWECDIRHPSEKAGRIFAGILAQII